MTEKVRSMNRQSRSAAIYIARALKNLIAFPFTGRYIPSETGNNNHAEVMTLPEEDVKIYVPKEFTPSPGPENEPEEVRIYPSVS
jgi:hypothetical protein